MTVWLEQVQVFKSYFPRLTFWPRLFARQRLGESSSQIQLLMGNISKIIKRKDFGAYNNFTLKAAGVSLPKTSTFFPRCFAHFAGISNRQSAENSIAFSLESFDDEGYSDLPLKRESVSTKSIFEVAQPLK